MVSVRGFLSRFLGASVLDRRSQKIVDEAQRIVAEAKATNAAPERVVPVGEFVNRRYFPHIEQYKCPSTIKGYKDIWANHLKGHCVDEWLKDVRTFHVQN